MKEHHRGFSLNEGRIEHTTERNLPNAPKHFQHTKTYKLVYQIRFKKMLHFQHTFEKGKLYFIFEVHLDIELLVDVTIKK